MSGSVGVGRLGRRGVPVWEGEPRWGPQQRSQEEAAAERGEGRLRGGEDPRQLLEGRPGSPPPPDSLPQPHH